METNEARRTVLIVDDTPENVSILNAALRDEYAIKVATRGKKAIEIAMTTPVDIILLDVMMPEMDGFETCRRLKAEARTRGIPVIFVTARGEIEDEAQGLSCGGVDYIAKPISAPIVQARVRTHLALYQQNRILEDRVRQRTGELVRVNEQLLGEIEERKKAEVSLLEAFEEVKQLKNQLHAENIYLRQEINLIHPHKDIVGHSEAIRAILMQVEQVAGAETTVLIQGETGTGKELIANAVHRLSDRKDRVMITVNCAALPATLIESELFGREKGAFTGADTRQIGRFEIANGSTLCLDEIGELPLDMQAKLLRVIQHGEFERLGSSKTIKVNVRLVATTNRNLDEEILAGRFRKDLYYRLNVFPITVPPLRQRREDIPLMVRAFVARYAEKMGKKITSISKEAMQKLQDYPWPGNVRELESIIERAVILCQGPGFQLADTLNIPLTSSPLAGGTVKEMEANLIMKVLSESRWRIEGKGGAAETLGLHPSTLRARMHKLEIVRPDINAPE